MYEGLSAVIEAQRQADATLVRSASFDMLGEGTPTDPRNDISVTYPNLGSQVDCFVSVPADRWKGEYYNSGNFTGSLFRVRDHGNGFLDYTDNCLPY
jgi:hypothetical protein